MVESQSIVYIARFDVLNIDHLVLDSEDLVSEVLVLDLVFGVEVLDVDDEDIDGSLPFSVKQTLFDFIMHSKLVIARVDWLLCNQS